jgi:hypothetical protein
MSALYQWCAWQTEKTTISFMQDSGDFAARRGGAQRASAIEPTQAEAIARAHALDPNAHVNVERVRGSRTGSPGKWRKG